MSKISLTVDSLVISKTEDDTSVLLIQRKNEPFKNQWALPGGFLDADETLKTAAIRELREETGLQVNTMHEIGIFDAVNRDPRGRMISVAFVTEVSKQLEVKGADDAQDAKWFSVKALPKLAFDHVKIIKHALKQIED